MTNTELMTPGQMRQLMNAVGSTIPADLSQAETQRLLKGPQMRRYLETFWDAMRTDEEKGLYVRLPKGDIVEHLYEQQLKFDGFKIDLHDPKNEQTLRSRLEPFHFAGNRSRHGSWNKKINIENESPAAIHRWLKRNGYRSADFRELVAYSMYNRPSTYSNDRHSIIAADGCADYDGVGGMGSWFSEDNFRVEFYFNDGIGAENYDRNTWELIGILAVEL